MRRLRAAVLVMGAAVGFATQAHAALIAFDFNDLGDDNGNSKVEQYMNEVLGIAHPGGTVDVTGSRAEKNYTGDDFVVGPIVGNKVVAETLGNTDGGVPHGGALDAFLVNSGADRIVMTFSFPIYSAVFDYEIFPDGTCPKQSQYCTPLTSNWPDFSFKADGVLQFKSLGVLPGTNGTYPNSPQSGKNKTELAPQLLDESGLWLFPQGVTVLEFIDWPRMIGIDNLVVNDHCNDEPPENPEEPVVPEPASLTLLGTGLIGLLGLRRGRRQV